MSHGAKQPIKLHTCRCGQRFYVVEGLAHDDRCIGCVIADELARTTGAECARRTGRTNTARASGRRSPRGGPGST